MLFSATQIQKEIHNQLPKGIVPAILYCADTHAMGSGIPDHTKLTFESLADWWLSVRPTLFMGGLVRLLLGTREFGRLVGYESSLVCFRVFTSLGSMLGLY